MKLTAERIRGRQVSIEIGEMPGGGWVAIGIVTHAPTTRAKPSNG
jgi:hypothetical protein